jgi:hypothetical protein
VVAVHGDPWLTGEKERVAEAIGARGVHGKGKRGANSVTVISWFCWAEEERRASRRRKAARKGNIAGARGDGRVEVISAGGGAAAAAERRPEATHCAGSRGGQSRARARGRRREEGGPRDLFGNSKNFRDLSV